MEITKATISNIKELCELLNCLFEEELEFLPNEQVQAQGLKIILENQDVGEILVAKKSHKIIGMVNLLYTVSSAIGGRVAILEDMVVSPNERGHGVGSKLLAKAIEVALNCGCKRITLLTDKDNEEAHCFYKKQGFNQSSMVVFRKLLNNEDGT